MALAKSGVDAVVDVQVEANVGLDWLDGVSSPGLKEACDVGLIIIHSNLVTEGGGASTETVYLRKSGDPIAKCTWKVLSTHTADAPLILIPLPSDASLQWFIPEGGTNVLLYVRRIWYPRGSRTL